MIAGLRDTLSTDFWHPIRSSIVFSMRCDVTSCIWAGVQAGQERRWQVPRTSCELVFDECRGDKQQTHLVEILFLHAHSDVKICMKYDKYEFQTWNGINTWCKMYIFPHLKLMFINCSIVRKPIQQPVPFGTIKREVWTSISASRRWTCTTRTNGLN